MGDGCQERAGKEDPRRRRGRRDIAHEETAATLAPATQGGEQIGFRRGVGLHSVRQCGDPYPPVPRQPRGHELGRLAAGVVGIETDGHEAKRRAVLEQQGDLFLADRAAHQGDRGNARPHRAVQPDGPEEPLDDRQRLALLDPVQVEQLALLVELGRQLVLALILGEFLVRPDPATGVGHHPAVRVMDRDAQPARYRLARAYGQKDRAVGAAWCSRGLPFGAPA